MVSVRQLSKEDWKLYKSLRLRALRDSPDAFGSSYEREYAFTDQRWIDRIEVKDQVHQAVLLVAEIDGQAIGIASGVVHCAGDETAYVYQMWVAPEARAHGAGRTLLERVICWAEELNISAINLDVTLSNTGAVKLYQAVGFVFFGEPKALRPGSSLLTQNMTLLL